MADAPVLRCPSRLHGVFVGENGLEVKCASKACGAGNGVVVLHYFDLSTGELTNTKKFQDPERVFNQGKRNPK